MRHFILTLFLALAAVGASDDLTFEYTTLRECNSTEGWPSNADTANAVVTNDTSNFSNYGLGDNVADLTLGEEELTNGDFSTGDLTGWTADASGWYYDNGGITADFATQGGATKYIGQDLAGTPLTEDDWYYLQYEVVTNAGNTSGEVKTSSTTGVFDSYTFLSTVNAVHATTLSVNAVADPTFDFRIFLQIPESGDSVTLDNFTIGKLNKQWSFGAGWTMTSGTLTHATGSTESVIQQSDDMTAGKTYEVKFYATVNAGSLAPKLADNTVAARNVEYTGWHTRLIIMGAGTNEIEFAPSSDFDGSITSLTVKEIIPQGIKLTTNSTSIARMSLEADSAIDAKMGIGVWYYIATADLPNINMIRFIVHEDGVAASSLDDPGWIYSIYSTTAHTGPAPKEGWTFAWLPRYLMSASASPAAWDLTYPVKSVEMQIRRSGSTDASVTLGKVVTDNANKGFVIIQYDDGKKGVSQHALPRMKSKGWRGVIAVNSISVGDPDNVTVSDLSEMYAAGWDVCNHTHSHLDMDAQNATTVASEIITTRNWLEEHGFLRGKNVLVWPGNSAKPTPSTEWYGTSIAEGAGIEIIRGASERYPSTTLASFDDLEREGVCWKLTDWSNIPFFDVYSVTGSETWADDFEEEITKITDNGGGVIIYTHDVTETLTGSINITTHLLDDILIGLKEEEDAGRLEVITITDWYARSMNLTVPIVSNGTTLKNSFMGRGYFLGY